MQNALVHNYLRRLTLLWLPFRSWPVMTGRTLRHDFWAGVTGAVLALPQGIAFAIIAGLPPVFGLYSAVVAQIVTAIFGSSRHLVSGPSVALSIIIPSIIAPHAAFGSALYVTLSFTLMFLAGIIQLSFSVFRLGWLLSFISPTVVTGFTFGAGVLTMASQLPTFFGIHVDSGPLLLRLAATVKALPQLHVPTLLVAVTTLLAAIMIRIFRPNWPYMLIGMLLGSLFCVFLGGEAQGVLMLGALPDGFPQLSLPVLDFHQWLALLPAACAIALVGLINATSIARSLAVRSGQRIDINKECFAQGLANFTGSFCSCYIVSGSFSRSAVNYSCGACTPLAQIINALFIIFILFLLPTLTEDLPLSAMAGVIILAAWTLMDLPRVRYTCRISRQEAAVLAVTFLSTLFLNLEFAIYTGVILSLVFHLQKIAHPVLSEADFTPLYQKLQEQPDFVPPLRAVHLNGSLFFGAVEHVRNHLVSAKSGKGRHLILLAEGLNHLDVSGIEMLLNERKRLRRKGGDLYIIGLKPYLKRELLHGPYWQLLGGETHLHESTYIAFREICLMLGIQNYRSYMKCLFRDYNRL